MPKEKFRLLSLGSLGRDCPSVNAPTTLVRRLISQHASAKRIVGADAKTPASPANDVKPHDKRRTKPLAVGMVRTKREPHLSRRLS